MAGKIAIITLVGKFNYGNRLQNYAVTRIYNRIGYVAESLELPDRPNLARSVKRFGRMLLGYQQTDPASKMSEERLAAFDKFNRSIQIRRLASLNSRLIDEYDFFSVGSDQVWNPEQITYNDDWFFLEFARPEQRIALAPSIGLDCLSSRQSKRIARGIAGFPRLSIREPRGAELIRKCCRREAKVICDPTLVLKADEWRMVADSHLTPPEPFVFTYLLGGVGAAAKDVLNRVTESGSIPVVSLSDREGPEEPAAGPAEFISLIDNASHVVTDSFHAAAFSSILQTPLTVVRREGGASMFSRLETLSQILGIEEKIYGSPTYDLSLAGNYDGVPEAIEREREVFMAYLKGCLGA